jgi:hypothetical protein
MEDGDGYSKKYHVIFKPTGIKRWWAKLLYKPFGHVLIATPTELEHFWIISDCKGGNVFTELVPMQDLRILYPDTVIMPFNSIVHKEPHFRYWFINCVEIVKLVLGIRDWKIITPYQLYKHIKESHNGKHVGAKKR